MKKSVALAFSGCSLMCIVLTSIALSTPAWVSDTTILGVINSIGLFELCIGDNCVQDPPIMNAAYVKTTKAFLIIALIFLITNFVYCVLVAMKKSSSKGIPTLFGLAALCSLIAMAIFSGKQTFTEGIYSYGYSYALGWAAYGLELILLPVSLILSKVSEYSVIP